MPRWSVRRDAERAGRTMTKSLLTTGIRGRVQYAHTCLDRLDWESPQGASIIHSVFLGPVNSVPASYA